MAKKREIRKKIPKKAIKTKRIKRPREEPFISSPQDKYPSWQFRKVDSSAPWSICPGNSKYSAEQLIKVYSYILKKLKDFETMKWVDLIGPQKPSHEIPVDKISKESQKRLRKIGLEDIDTLVSLRLGAKERLWGIKDNECFKILWWDPNHEICPSRLKHT